MLCVCMLGAHVYKHLTTMKLQSYLHAMPPQTGGCRPCNEMSIIPLLFGVCFFPGDA